MSLFARRIAPRLLKRLARRRVVVLTGARQTGKTTLVRELLPARAPSPLHYLSLDDPDERLRVGADPVRSLDRPDRLVVLDEVQKLPSLLDAVKVLADRKEGQRFLLLGSSQILHLREVRESLAGRATLLDLWPLSVGEKCGGVEDAPTVLDRVWEEGPAVLRRADVFDPEADRARALRAAAEETLFWGGYPPVRSLPDDAERRQWFRDYRRSFLERDLADLGRVADLDPFARAQVWIAARTGRPLSFSDLARELGVAVNTAKRFVRFLEVSYQAVLLPPFLPNIERRLAKNPKVCWTDAGLARTLAERWDAGDGPLFESYVAAEILKWASFRDDAPALHFFRTHGGLEVDLVLAAGRDVVGIECRASSRAHVSDARPLASFLGDIFRGPGRRLGLVVYRGREVAELERHVWAVPDWILFGPVA
ncbi:MAG: ATP-binding protein [Planctomycetes bacterium]|nr:ATP-binding protein [Planctomycetota bacterium]